MYNDYGNHVAYAVAPIHDRQMVVLTLDLTAPEAGLQAPLPAGSLSVEQVR